MHTYVSKYLIMNKIIITSIFLIAIGCNNSYAQSVSINTDGSTADSSAILDVKVTTKGSADSKAHKKPKGLDIRSCYGLLIYQTDNDKALFIMVQPGCCYWLCRLAQTIIH